MAEQISHRHRCIFIHIPKAAGTSIESTALFDDQRHRTGEHVGGHTTALEFRRRHPDLFSRYFKFSFVRNPFSRVVSAFLYLSRGGTTPDDRLLQEDLAEYAGDFQSFCEDFLRTGRAASVPHLRPQVDFVCDERGTVLVDFLGRVESLNNDFKAVTATLGVSAALPHKNRTRGIVDHLQFYTDKRTRQVVQTVYARDFEMFGYGFPRFGALSLPRLQQRLGRYVRPFLRQKP